MATMTNKHKHERQKSVQEGNARLERHSGSGFRGDSKKKGCGGKGTWGDALDDWERGLWDYQEELYESKQELQTILIPKVAAAPERTIERITKKSEKSSGLKKSRRLRTAGGRMRHPLARSPTDKIENQLLASSTTLTIQQVEQQRINFGAGFETTVSMGSTYDETVTIRTFQDELQALVKQLAGPESSLSSDLDQLNTKKLLSKQMNKRNNCCRNPRNQNRNGVRVNQPGTRMGVSMRCH